MKKSFLYILISFIFCLQGLIAQCYPDRHSTTWFDGWVSCEVSENPNSTYGESHWIMYDFGYKYELNDTKFWNTNEPSHLDYGIQEFSVDHSLDGNTWTNLGTFTLQQANGESIYEGQEGPDFDGTTARYVLITPLSNFGGDCFGFGELKINITDPFKIIDKENGFNASVYPNPFVNNINLRIASLHPEKPISYALYDILGRRITQNNINLIEGTETYNIDFKTHALTIGIYILKVEQNGKQRSFKLIKSE